MYLISPHKKQYKANLHCHSVISDGKRTPEEFKEMYKNHGYSILAITDHETPCCHSVQFGDGAVFVTLLKIKNPEHSFAQDFLLFEDKL